LRICYLDTFSGVSGDMTLAALLDCGITLPALKSRMSGLKLPGYSLTRTKVRRHGISATRLEVRIRGKEKRRNLDDIFAILEKSDIEGSIRSMARSIFRSIARAEAKIHGERIRQTHFHEVGATDAIVDVVGVLTAMAMLEVEQLFSTPIPLGTGFVDTSHGLMPVPAPATLGLLAGYPVVRTDREEELTTPTGAALISELSSGVIPPSPFVADRVGYGAGARVSEEYPNLLRAIIGDVDDEMEGDCVLAVETNIDDMDPQLLPHLQEEIFNAGALDVYLSPVHMKKNRPGLLLRLLVEESYFDRVAEVMFRESTTIGLRYWEVSRLKLRRRIEDVETSLGKVRVKEAVLPSGEKRRKVEHDDCLRIAAETGIPLMEVVSRIEREISR